MFPYEKTNDTFNIKSMNVVNSVQVQRNAHARILEYH